MGGGEESHLLNNLYLGAIQIMRDTLGGGVETVSPNDTWGSGGSKIGQKSVTYYLNGPLRHESLIHNQQLYFNCFRYTTG